MENIIFNELKVRGYNVDVGVRLNEINKSYESIRKQLRSILCATRPPRDIMSNLPFACRTSRKRTGAASLLMVPDAFKKVIITKDAPAPLYNEDGILVMSIFDFLLDEDSLER